MVAYTAADLPAQGNSQRGRGVYVVERELDIAAQITTNGADYAANDTETMINIPKGTVVLSAGIEILTAGTATAATVDLGIASVADKYVDGLDITGAAGTYGATPAAEAAQVFVATADDTLDLKFATEDALTAGKLRVWAVMMDVTAVGNMHAAEVVRDTLA